MKRKLKSVLSFVVGTAALVSMSFGFKGQTVNAAGNESIYQEVIEFEDAKKYEQNGNNYIDSSRFSGYSGSGYLYLASGWGEVDFTVPQDGEYKITIVTNADSYKENWLYLDDNGVGTLYTFGNNWDTYTVTSYLSAGTHKFGVSTSWGYTALDYVMVEPVSGSTGSGSSDSSNQGGNNSDNQGTQTNGMYVSGGKLYAANGREFIMRGVNVAHAWYPDQTYTSINAIADLGANCVRVVLANGQKWTRTSYSEVQDIISWCKARGLICILEMHDATGSDSTSDLNNAVNYWIEIKEMLNANKDYVIVNIANEWYGSWNSSAWASGNKSAIQALRNAGIDNVLMVDCAGWGQYPNSIKEYGKEVYNADSHGNTMFSIHMYEYAGGDATTVKTNIDNSLATGVPLVIGEFGGQHTNGDVDEYTIMSYCQRKGTGYLGWSWKGNNSDLGYLDVANSWDGSSLSTWGNTLFYDTYGIKNTARMAY